MASFLQTRSRFRPQRQAMTANDFGAAPDGATDSAAAIALGFTAVDELIVPAGSYTTSSLTVPAGKTLVLQRGAYLQVSGTTISVQGQIRAPSAILGPPGLCASLGDSRAAASNYTVPGTTLSNINTLWTMCMLRTKGALHWTPELGVAVGGSDTTSLDTQITTLFALSLTPRYCYILTGTNDAVDITAAEQVRRFVNAWLRLLGKGIVPIHFADLPRVQSSYTAARASRNRRAHGILAALARHMGVEFVDPSSVMTDYSNTTGDPLAASFNADLIHQNPVGNYQMAGLLATQLTSRLQIPPLGYLASPTGADVYDATNNPNGNSWTNPLFLGTGGSEGTGVTGDTPTGYTATRNTGASSAVSAVVARSDGPPGNWWEITVGSPTAELNEFIINVNGMAGVAGQTVIFACDVLCASMTGIAGATIEVNQTGTASSTAWKAGDNASSAATAGDTPATYAGRLVLGPYVLQSGCTSCRVRLTAKFPTGSSGVVRFGNPYFAILP